MKKNNKKEITMDKLAEMMQREFGVVGEKINTVKRELKYEIKKENKKLEERMDKRFDEVLGREDKIFKRLENLETDNTMSAGASRRQEDKLENHEERIVAAEEKLGVI